MCCRIRKVKDRIESYLAEIMEQSTELNNMIQEGQTDIDTSDLAKHICSMLEEVQGYKDELMMYERLERENALA